MNEAALNTLLLAGGVEDPVAFLLIMFPVLALYFYFIPSIAGRNTPNRWTILLVNLLLGWTIVGWGYALFLALKKSSPHFTAQVSG
jgi:hypothetical protein